MAFRAATTGITTPLLFPQANAPYDIIPSMAFGGLTNQTSPSVSINGSPFFQQIPVLQRERQRHQGLGQAHHQGRFLLLPGDCLQHAAIARAGVHRLLSSLGTNANFPLDSGDPFANALLGVFTSYTQASQKVATNSCITR